MERCRMLGLGLAAVAGTYQHRSHAGDTRCLDVAQRITDRRHGFEIQAEPLGQIEQHAGAGFALVRSMLRMVRREEDSVDAATDFRELYLQTIVHREERVVVEPSPAASGLMSDAAHAIARLTQPPGPSGTDQTRERE